MTTVCRSTGLPAKPTVLLPEHVSECIEPDESGNHSIRPRDDGLQGAVTPDLDAGFRRANGGLVVEALRKERQHFRHDDFPLSESSPRSIPACRNKPPALVSHIALVASRAFPYVVGLVVRLAERMMPRRWPLIAAGGSILVWYCQQ
jgi:hypothetical protein